MKQLYERALCLPNTASFTVAENLRIRKHIATFKVVLDSFRKLVWGRRVRGIRLF